MLTENQLFIGEVYRLKFANLPYYWIITAIPFTLKYGPSIYNCGDGAYYNPCPKFRGSLDEKFSSHTFEEASPEEKTWINICRAKGIKDSENVYHLHPCNNKHILEYSIY